MTEDRKKKYQKIGRKKTRKMLSEIGENLEQHVMLSNSILIILFNSQISN